MTKEKGFSIVSKGVKYKLRIAFCLMSILPLLVLIYIVTNYTVVQSGLKADILLFIFIAVSIASIGFLLVKEIINRIVLISEQASIIASENIQKGQEGAKPVGADEIAVLGITLNQLTQHIRSNMEELKNYGRKTTEINLRIQSHVLIFSNLLQISNLISEGVNLEEILNLIVEKCRPLADSDVTYLLFKEEAGDVFYMKAANALSTNYLLKIEVKQTDSIFSELIKTGNPLVLDKEHTVSEYVSAAFYEKFGIKNTLAQPIYLKNALVGIVGIGNTKDSFTYTQDEIKLLDVFSKQAAIAIENDKLMNRLEKLEIKDALTGLYNKTYILGRLQEEIRRAVVRQRPCSFVLFNIDDFQKFRSQYSVSEVENKLKTIASLIRDAVSEVDRVARYGENEFAIVLPERNKRHAQEIAEEVRKKIESSFDLENDPKGKLTVSGGVSENPLDGISSEELITKAEQLLLQAKQQGKNRIVV